MDELGFIFCQEQPCLARTPECTIMIHVDDILFVGLTSFWKGVFLTKMKERFSVSHDELKGVGSSITGITFPGKKITEVEGGLILAPGTTVDKVASAFETSFGLVRSQKLPSDSTLQVPDRSQKLSSADASAYRSIVGLCLRMG